MPVLLVLSTAPDARTAGRLASLLLRERLAACVSFKEGFVSRYRWKGRIEKQKETLLIIKTTQNKFLKLKKVLSANHPYEVPEILAVPVTGGSKKYMKWLQEETR